MTKQLTVNEHLALAEHHLNIAASRLVDFHYDAVGATAHATVAIGIYLSVLLSQMYPLHEPPKEGDGA